MLSVASHESTDSFAVVECGTTDGIAFSRSLVLALRGIFEVRWFQLLFTSYTLLMTVRGLLSRLVVELCAAWEVYDDAKG